MGLEQYQGDVAMCHRCSACKFVPMQKVANKNFLTFVPASPDIIFISIPEAAG